VNQHFVGKVKEIACAAVAFFLHPSPVLVKRFRKEQENKITLRGKRGSIVCLTTSTLLRHRRRSIANAMVNQFVIFHGGPGVFPSSLGSLCCMLFFFAVRPELVREFFLPPTTYEFSSFAR